jgi:gliding motility-associated-like protein
MKKLVFVIFILHALTYKSFGQYCYGVNLVPNPSLDTVTTCPWNGWQIEYAAPWSSNLTKPASTALHQCMFNDPNTQMDTAALRKVNWRTQGMAYLIVWADDNWRTYIEVPLKKKLDAGKCYYAEFYVLTHNVSYKVIDALGIYFSDTLVKTGHDTIMGGDTLSFIEPIYVTPQIYQPGKIVKDSVNWTKVSGTFTAAGTETAMIVGNFIPNDQIHWEILNNSPMQSSRYMFDDFLVCACEDTIMPSGHCFIPNIFSPNGDGINDIFTIRGERIEQVSLKIYNRWGNLVFMGNDVSPAWDGRWQGKECPIGVYYYTAEVTYLNGAVEQKHGNVTIVR